MSSKHINSNRTGAQLGGLFLIALAILIPTVADAQGSVRAWGMGGAHTAAARGLEAAEYNPANLALGGGTSIGLAAAAVDIHNNSLSLDRYNEITGAHLNAADKTRLLADIPDGGFKLDTDIRASILGVRSGSFALTFNAIGAGQGNLDKDYFDLVLFGNQVGETVDFSDTYGEGYAMGTATLSYGRELMATDRSRLSFGVNVKYLHGIYEMHVDEAHGSISTTMDEIAGEAYVSTLSSEGGAGYGLDLGFTLQAPNGWQLALVVDNLYTKLDWNTNVERNEFRVTAADLNMLNDDMEDSIADTDTTYEASGYSTTLPRQLRLGAANRLGSFNVAVDYTQGFEDRGLSSTTPQINAGAEWWLTGIVQPRFGVRFGGASGSAVSGGLGLRLGFWRLDLAAMTRGGLKPGDTKGLGFAVGSTLDF